jgi:methylmalonyl-CoA/ethylmalonyl-CoA epimerase
LIGKLNHIAIVVPDLKASAETYKTGLGAEVSLLKELPEHGVSVVFVELVNTKIELLHPLGDNSPIRAFLNKNPKGGMHHVCFEVHDLIKARDRLIAEGKRVIGDGKPSIGAHGKPVLFLHPNDFSGTLIEIEEA